MLNFSGLKVTIVLAVCLLAVYFSLPTLFGKEKDTMPYLPDSKINLGLDLRGGSYLLLEVNFKAYINEQLDNLRGDIRNAFRDKKVNGQRIGYAGGINLANDKITFTLTDPSIASDVKDIIKKISSELNIKVNGANIEVAYDDMALKTMHRNIMDQSIEIVRRRVDETGTREPDIQKQGDNRILLQVPGLEDPEYLKQLLGKTAKLTFHLLDESFPYPDTSKTPVPPGTARVMSEDGSAYAIKTKVMLSGDLLAGANAAISTNSQPVVNIKFNNVGAKKFADITKENVGKPFAIVLDNKVLTAPVIRSVILGGTAEISGNFTTKSANDLALLLRAGALPAPLDIVEERSVGPSLGADSIESGKKAIIYGMIFVTGFMFLFYGLFGMFANIALIINMFMVVAIMGIFGATLTLPGIAGLVLTMGMSVDANVLIFERLREEIKLGRSAYAAIDHGFQQAFRTIFDSHITTLSAAVFLYIFGAGAVKGFAVTLAAGIITSLFSAVLLTRLMVVVWLKKFKPKNIPI
ncbi:MAG: protein-export rane protein SecD [Rickettsiaceae bacterium]|jgi:protein-export membrane protein SecD|nr:protein-export rane protein SecD [Rickettsiaceae bacterium]